ncbi:hypothetical protein [Acinetobacter schindleri]|uniref:hypothetical protein n=1 Tax=Acinetobacter schindleri TaxID=108981 RepID=UPI003F57304F
MKKFEPFKGVHFIEILFEIPWKAMVALFMLTGIAAICDVIHSFFTDKTYEFDLLNNVFNTLLNTNSFLLWVFFIAFILHMITSITFNYKLYHGKKLSLKSNFLVKTFEYTGFFIIEVFYLIGTFCFATSLLALLILDFSSLLTFVLCFPIFLGVAVGAHYIYLSARISHIGNER